MPIYHVEIPEELDRSIKSLGYDIGKISLSGNQPNSHHVTQRGLVCYLLQTGLEHTSPEAANDALKAGSIRRGRPALPKALPPVDPLAQLKADMAYAQGKLKRSRKP